jgi:GNAT superfamily N-acetyltransferase
LAADAEGSYPSAIPCHAPANEAGYALLVAGDLIIRAARSTDSRAIAEVSVASRRWSYRELLAGADLAALSVEATTANFAEGLAELGPDSAVLVAGLTGRAVGYAYVLPSPDSDVPAESSELGSIYVTEEVAGTGVSPTLMNSAVEHARAAGHGILHKMVVRGKYRGLHQVDSAAPDVLQDAGKQRSLREPQHLA